MDLSELAAIQHSGRTARRHPWELSRADFVIRRLRGKVDPGRPVVDVGCGDAFMLARVCQALGGLNGFGVDTAYRPEVEVTPGPRVFSSLDSLPVEAGPAGVLLLMDVLEHVEEPVDLLRDLVARKLVDAQTVLWVTVPAWQFLFCRQDQWLGHYRRYRTGLLQEHLAAGGIETTESGYFFSSLVVIRALEVLAEKLGLRRTDGTGLVGWQGGPFLSSLLSGCLTFDALVCQQIARLTGLKIPGLTCYALGRLR